jgi:hypothetical protein
MDARSSTPMPEPLTAELSGPADHRHPQDHRWPLADPGRLPARAVDAVPLSRADRPDAQWRRGEETIVVGVGLGGRGVVGGGVR